MFSIPTDSDGPQTMLTSAQAACNLNPLGKTHRLLCQQLQPRADLSKPAPQLDCSDDDSARVCSARLGLLGISSNRVWGYTGENFISPSASKNLSPA